MAQVLTSEGLADFYQGKATPEFVKPEEPKTEIVIKGNTIDGKPQDEPSPVSTEHLDDKVEDDQGLTAAERKAYSEKIARKISAKHRALKQAEAAIGKESQGRQAAEKQASDLKAEIAQLKAKVDDGEGPKRDDFKSDGEWWDAKIQWRVDQGVSKGIAERETKREQERVEVERRTRIAKFAEGVDDYDETVESLKGVPQHQAVIDYMSDADLGPALIYYFGSHPDEYQKLASMKPVFAVAEVGKVETRLERKAEKVEKTVKADEALDTLKAPISRAPAPITTLHETASVVTKDPSKMDVDELREFNRAQRRQQQR